ncbi:MAG: hypothetical protein KDB60_17730 [Propionibacteriaceae bacterium]|nr:hypothetical protein [Propionibacteriaceae bacterium]
MVWNILEALALLAICAGGYLIFGPWALIAWGVLVIVLSLVVNRKGGSA